MVSMASSFDKEGDNILPMGPLYHKSDCNITWLPYKTKESLIFYLRIKTTTRAKNSAQASEVPCQQLLVEANTDSNKNLKGYIQGTGYMCGCNDCKFEKALNAYEFERHASCKTKHPNNHIYFDNGKTIYAVVQELKNTPQELLFDAIQTVTGSQINQKNFRIWKASYQAATRELQRIYGNDDAVVSSLR
ncbi:Detected protein of unknown function [Hibiscus syriacus]|uniref:Tify domain-containing protein n=1 Tax=Hibiscus syriacus TaxID=106335 RepID=A0A6A2YRU4_HIBSY|nr:Detected protein of unknown function [Hibiscus syriacus]